MPILALTASVMQGEPERCRAAGMDDFAAKPTTIPFLASKLRQWLPDVDVGAGRGGARRRAAARSRAAAASADGPIDPSVLEEMTGRRRRARGRGARRVRHDDARRPRRAGRAPARRGAVDDVRRLAHRIKGAARAVGAPPTADLAHQIESLAALGGDDRARFEVLLGELSAALEELVAVVGAA